MSEYTFFTDGNAGMIEVITTVLGGNMPAAPGDAQFGTGVSISVAEVFPDGSVDNLFQGGGSIWWDAAGIASISNPTPDANFFYPVGTEAIVWTTNNVCAFACGPGVAEAGAIVTPFSPSPTLTPLPAALPLFATGLLLFAVTRRLRHKSQPR